MLVFQLEIDVETDDRLFFFFLLDISLTYTCDVALSTQRKNQILTVSQCWQSKHKMPPSFEVKTDGSNSQADCHHTSSPASMRGRAASLCTQTRSVWHQHINTDWCTNNEGDEGNRFVLKKSQVFGDNDHVYLFVHHTWVAIRVERFKGRRDICEGMDEIKLNGISSVWAVRWSVFSVLKSVLANCDSVLFYCLCHKRPKGQFLVLY